MTKENVLRIQAIASLLPEQNASQQEWVSALPILEELISEIRRNQESEELRVQLHEAGLVDAKLALQMLERRHRYALTVQYCGEAYA